MKQLIYDLLKKWSCCHKWQIHAETAVYSGYVTMKDYKNFLPIGRDQVLICSNCGKIQKLRV